MESKVILVYLATTGGTHPQAHLSKERKFDIANKCYVPHYSSQSRPRVQVVLVLQAEVESLLFQVSLRLKRLVHASEKYVFDCTFLIKECDL